jgi:hypothetical protein
MPALGGCVYAEIKVTVEPRGCMFKFGELVGGPGLYHPSGFDLACPATTPMILRLGESCTWTLGSQALGETSTLSNRATSPQTLEARLNAAGITYTSSGGPCGAKGTRNNGVFEGNLIIKGYLAKRTEQVGVFIG